MINKKQIMSGFKRLVRDVSHDISNPLMVAMVQAKMLQEKCGDDVRVGQRAKQVLSATEQIFAITEKLKSLTNQIVKNTPTTNIELNQILNALIDSQMPLLQSRSIEIQTELCSQQLNIKGNHDQIILVFKELIDNSCKAFNAIQSDDPKWIKFSSNIGENGHIEIRYSDNAGGISQETQDHLFNFFSIKNLDQKNINLGLPLINSIVEEHNGSLKLNSQIDKGSTFTITFF